MASDSSASDSGAGSDLIRLATLASKHSIALGKTIESYKSIRPQVPDDKGNIEFNLVSEESTSDSVQELKERVSRMKAQMASIEDRRINHLVQKVATTNNSATAASELAADLAAMTKEFKLTREMTDELSSTIARLEVEMASSVIDNRGEGDVLQFFVSTKGKSLRGKNVGTGQKIQQFVGYAEDETVKQVSKDMSRNSSLNAQTSEDLSDIADAVKAQVVRGESAHRPGPLAITYTSLHPATSHEPLAKVPVSRQGRLR
ncbi:hypothetical protein HMPREF1624_01929 [Sporothrix schenckii ATCC 58251]|uniref:Uncharacterized protein n=1 Tax=Sporothrix schenckii (strain ATCC 58251 / de Perez 2211183) TaxID=1391915 RepID=U7Q0I0_SPOS1|nr:hypothetical protein HMPREF1624_01929 [Sporothrix schenckii ATCC 58251]